MIIGDKREQVIQNIKQAANHEHFTAKTEIGDPVLSLNERTRLVSDFWQDQSSLKGKINNKIGHAIFNILVHTLTASTKFDGLENLKDIPTDGAIVTANHFNQIDEFAIKHLASKTHHQLAIVIEDTNLKLPGFLSYLMHYVGTIPLIRSTNYMGNEFPKHLHDALAKNNWVLIYPEQEMWWNYRKPRKLQRGAYYFAAKQNVPIISTFIEIQTINKKEKDHPNFYKTKYIVHVLPPIYPQPELSLKQNSQQMLEKDYQQKVAAYEKCYHKKLDYRFTPWDIAGWCNE
ncbi:lysophospholipid acyltransferase family protein [Lactobacillus sp. ESL0681]|uniref:lysophospholipid acyltransferase family protein n=1 Tax=Lactobacillus sp. ESL0681 TaxID=2983211 RepID=UPI0023F6517F|nr:lysophospholipid acyltransferase family protein [Lactobacillus sp. ESL0681]WEV39750.1 lysophospholipid acyltransferase family protein [Lactobacillus sp. ESL0681]